MEPLEDVLRKVEDLRRDLSAEIVVQPERGHWEGPKQHLDWVESGEDYWVVDKPRIAEPDTQKREEARTQLQQIHDSSEWYSARYGAGRALGKPVNHEIESWSQELRAQLKAETLIEGGTDVYHRESSSGGDAREAVWDESDIIEPDLKTRKKAVEDVAELLRFSGSGKLRDLLEEAYDLKDTYSVDSDGTRRWMTGNIIIRKKAGKALGYSPLRIWAHEHPVLATVTGMATAGAASGLVYALVEYLNK